jgi:DNA-binding response OmpR family regulator
VFCERVTSRDEPCSGLTALKECDEGTFMARILVIDDEPELARFVRRALENEGHQVAVSTGGAEGLSRALADRPDLVVLDLRMPGVNGQAVLGGVLAQDAEQKVLVLSAAADVETRVECLERGAVDFLAKPFSVRELVARVRARLPGSSPHSGGGDIVSVGGMTLDLRRRQVGMNGRTCELSHREFLLLLCLMRRAGVPCSRAELLSEVWGYDFDPGTNVVEACVARLRSKLPGDVVRTVRNVGYEIQPA